MPTSAPQANPDRKQRSTLTVRGSTTDAVSLAAKVFEEMGWQGTFGASDIFKAVIVTQSADSHDVKVEGRWRTKTTTDVLVETELPPAQHAYFLERLQAAFDAEKK